MRSTLSGATIFVCITIMVAVPALAGLQWLQPLPHGNNLNDVEFLDDSTAIAVGGDGTTMVSRDGGLTWSISTLEIPGQPLPLGDPLRNLARLDASTAVATGGFLHRSTDAGGTWTTGAGSGLHDVDFEGNLGFGTAPSAGSPRGILRSVDGGQTWSSVYDEAGRVLEVDVVSATCIVGAGDNFVRSVDGGDTWTTLPFDAPDLPTSLSFVDELHGVIAVGTDRLYVTGDGGVTWTERVLDPVYSGAYVWGYDVEMLDQNTCFVAGQNASPEAGTGTWLRTGQFLRSTDDGATWQSEFGDRRFVSLARNQAGDVLLVGDAGIICRWTALGGIEQITGSHLLATDDGGQSAFLDSDHGIVVASRVTSATVLPVTPSMILRTNNAGQTWSYTRLSSTHLTDVAMTTSGAYAVGSQIVNGTMHNVLLKSLDGGETWSTVWSTPLANINFELKTIAFGSPTHGVALQKRGNGCIVIDNDTVTLAASPPPVGYTYQDAAMSGQVALAVTADGGSGWMFRSSDGGATWTQILMPFPRPSLYAVAFASPQVCVAAGAQFVRSDDGGLTWSPATSQGNFPRDVKAVAFSSASHGLAVGEFAQWGAVYETMDGGQTWIGTATAARPFAGVACFEPFRAIISGPGLEILEYVNQPVPTLFSSFVARGERFAADLRWAIHDGSAPAHFEIQRRAGDVTRTVAATLPAGSRAYRDESVVPGATYEYTLVALDEDGSMTSSAPVSVTIPSAALELLPNQPNPFNPATTIRFVVPVRDRVRLSVYDVAGRHVTTLIDEVRDAGTHSAQWNGTDARGDRVASGVYLSRLESGKTSVTKKMMLLK